MNQLSVLYIHESNFYTALGQLGFSFEVQIMNIQHGLFQRIATYRAMLSCSKEILNAVHLLPLARPHLLLNFKAIVTTFINCSSAKSLVCLCFDR